jgi:hypothetical protein
MKRSWSWSIFCLASLAACSSNSPKMADGGPREAGSGGGDGAAGAWVDGDGAAGAWVDGDAGERVDSGDAAGGGGTEAGGSAGAAESTGGGKVYVFPPPYDRNTDILFVIDDAPGIAVSQKKLTASLSSYTDTLKANLGSFPNMQLAVISTDMGAGHETGISGCRPGGDAGAFHANLVGTSCGLNALPPGDTFIRYLNGGSNTLVDIYPTLACIASLGDHGCGFKHPLASVMRALGADGAPGPPANDGFLRDYAFLQIVVVTSEDDCSAPPDSDLFDETSRTITDPLGPLQSYRCNEFGHLCGGAAPPRTMAADLSGTCVSNEHGKLLQVDEIVKALKALKSDPSRVYVTVIAGAASPYKVALAPSQVQGDSSQWPHVEHSCTAADGATGDPAVRLQQWVAGFGANGLFESICGDTLAPALQASAQQLAKAVLPPCIDLGTDPNTCSYVEHDVDAKGQPVDIVLPNCTSTWGLGACWTALPGTPDCRTGWSVTFQHPPMSTFLVNTTATCP